MLKYFSALTILFLVFLAACNYHIQKKIPPKAIKGVLDLTDWDFRRDGRVDLSGEYAFYWKQHLNPSDFSKPILPQKTGFIRVPGYWNGYEVNGETLHGYGYATYRLKILLNAQKETLAFKFLTMGTAYTFFLNGQKISSVGTAGNDRETTHPRYFPQVVEFKPETNQMDVIFQVSNFHHRRGGLWEVIHLGEEKEIQKIREERLCFALILFGSIFIMALYHLCLFALRKTDRSFLYFGVFCFLIMLRLLTTGERYIVYFFPNIPWEIVIKTEYLSFYLSVPFLVLFAQSLFPQEISKRILNLIVPIGIAFSCSVIFTPARIFSYTLQPFQIITILTIMYGFYVLIVASIRKRTGAFVFLLGFIVLALSAINDMLYVEKIIQTGYFAPFGVFIFIFSQALLLSFRLTHAFEIAERQYKELKDTYQAYRGEIIDRVQAEADLRASEEKYRAILHGMADIYYEVDLVGNLTFFNEPLCEMLGYSRDELSGMNNRQFMTEETGMRVYETFNKVYQTGEPSKTYDWEAITKDGSKRYVELSVSLIQDAEGRPVGFRGITHDITNRKQAEDQVRLHQEQLFQASKMVALGTLVSGVAHEVNNPNSFIRLNTPTLLEAWESATPILDEYYRENGDFILGGMNYSEMREKIPVLFSGILDGSERIKQIVEDLKNFVRKDISGMTQSVNVNDVLLSAISLISNMIKKSTHRFSVEYAMDLPVLTGQAQRLEQVFINLIQNACQALPDSEKGIFVSTYWDEANNDIRIKIQDQGVGISPESLPQITDPFFSTKHDSGGVGLGLSISSRIVEAHDGRLTFISEVGEGTTAEVFLPVKEK
ncbi:MAG: PAS domain S-box protein [Deltaproteobacteria bacterium]|nr:PAS domain S-box protein [Deltaproteobacteria bacterium]